LITAAGSQQIPASLAAQQPEAIAARDAISVQAELIARRQ